MSVAHSRSHFPNSHCIYAKNPDYCPSGMIDPAYMSMTVLTMSRISEHCENRYVRCQSSMNADLRQFGMRVEIHDGDTSINKCRLFYIGIDDIYAEEAIRSDPFIALWWCADQLMGKFHDRYGTADTEAVHKIRAIRSLPYPIKSAIADCISWDARQNAEELNKCSVCNEDEY
jgi:hypothetical protein